jgi:hypothetical protein
MKYHWTVKVSKRLFIFRFFNTSRPNAINTKDLTLLKCNLLSASEFRPLKSVVLYCVATSFKITAHLLSNSLFRQNPLNFSLRFPSSNDMQACRKISTFRWSILPPSSELKSTLCCSYKTYTLLVCHRIKHEIVRHTQIPFWRQTKTGINVTEFIVQIK